MTRHEKVTCVVFCTDPSGKKAQTYRRTNDDPNSGAVIHIETCCGRTDGQMGFRVGWVERVGVGSSGAPPP